MIDQKIVSLDRVADALQTAIRQSSGDAKRGARHAVVCVAGEIARAYGHDVGKAFERRAWA